MGGRDVGPAGSWGHTSRSETRERGALRMGSPRPGLNGRRCPLANVLLPSCSREVDRRFRSQWFLLMKRGMPDPRDYSYHFACGI